MNDELQQLLKSLGLGRVAEIYDEQLQLTQAESLTHTDFMLRLLRPQWHARQEKALSWRRESEECCVQRVPGGAVIPREG